MSQAQFADRCGFGVKSLQTWEQGVCQPSDAARAFLQVIAREHRAVTRALSMVRVQRRAAPESDDKWRRVKPSEQTARRELRA